MIRQQQEVLPQKRQAGVCLHVTSLPGPYGIGEIGESALRFVDFIHETQLGVWQFLPIGPTAYGDSPYQPSSTFAGNELLIDVASLIERGLLRRDEVRELESLPQPYVDYGALIPLKNEILRIAAGRFAQVADSAFKAEYDNFLEYHNSEWLHDYALFRILKTHHNEQPWPDWQAKYAHRDKDAIRKLEASFADRVETVKVIQFLFHYQWQQLKDYANTNSVRLFGDMPLYIGLDSADAWANPELLQLDRNGHPNYVAGVPPDYFSETGQLWGNPLYAWEAHAADGYRWWIERLRASAELADIVRIDHFRGFEAYWSVPIESETASIGTWMPGPANAIFDAMQGALGQLPIVAEDLGMITPEVEALRDRYHIPGLVVLQFGIVEKDFDLNDVVDYCVCYTGTHDNDTTIGWFKGSPNDNRSAQEIRDTQQAVLRLTDGTPETIHTDLINAAFATDARLAIAPIQDYLGLGSEARINTPGTSSNNWRWRIDPAALNEPLSDHIAMLVQSAGRGLSN